MSNSFLLNFREDIISDEETIPFDISTFSEYFGLLPSKKYELIIRSIEGENDDIFIDNYKPNFIILHDADCATIRRIETYQASNPYIKLGVYFLVYENSVEEQRFLLSIRKEKESFEKLISEKSVMAIPVDQGVQYDKNLDDIIFDKADTRIGGLNYTSTKSRKNIIVDIREFMSNLPSHLHSYKFDLYPCTLLIGDYILSPDICVERKSIPDLIGSFSSGRLYNQMASMSMYYKTSVLLIEFEEDKDFSFSPLGDLKTEISTNDITSKLALLSLAFPKMKIIWSDSPYSTCKIFAELKKLNDEPDMDIAIQVGSDHSQFFSKYNVDSYDFLRNLPGVTSNNVHEIVNHVENLFSLFTLSLDNLSGLIGIENGKKLYDFSNKKP